MGNPTTPKPCGARTLREFEPQEFGSSSFVAQDLRFRFRV